MMSFLNTFYDNNYGMVHAAQAMGSMQAAANARRAAEAASIAAEEQRKARQSQERVEASQRRIEEDAKEANRKRLQLEHEKVAMEKLRHEADQRQKDQAASFRRFTAFSIAFTDKVIAALD